MTKRSETTEELNAFFDEFTTDSLGSKEAAAAYGFQTVSGFHSARCRGEITVPAYRVGRKVRFLKSDIARDIKSRRLVKGDAA